MLYLTLVASCGNTCTLADQFDTSTMELRSQFEVPAIFYFDSLNLSLSDIVHVISLPVWHYHTCVCIQDISVNLVGKLFFVVVERNPIYVPNPYQEVLAGIRSLSVIMLNCAVQFGMGLPLVIEVLAKF